MSKKEGLDFDELGTFGLSNNTFQLDVADFKEYNGNELLLKYAAVKDGEEFNVENVFFNQKMDTHPPLYYLLVNFISSIRKGTFSMWYGLIINLFFMVILFWEMRYLFNLVMENDLISTILSLITFFTYGFVNEIVFIRMYVMLSSISMAFVILIIEIIKSYKTIGVNSAVGSSAEIVGASNASPHSKNKFIFVALFFILCVLGILTQYHFMILAFYFSLVLGIFLISKKDFRTLICFVLAGLLSIGVSIFIFPGMINHIFGEESLHALNDNQVNSLVTRFYEIIRTIYRSFFGIGFWIYLVILFIAIIFAVLKSGKQKEGLKSIIVNNKWFFIILFACIFYYLVICLTIKYTFARYLYNIYPLIILSIISAIYLLYKNIKPALKYIAVLLIMILVFTSRYNDTPFSLNIGNKLFEDHLKENHDIAVLGVYSSVDKRGRSDTQGMSLWKIHRPLYSFRYMDKVSFVDLNRNQDLLYVKNENISKNDALYIVIYVDDNDDEILSGIMRNNGFANVSKVLFNTYYHMYLITK